MGQKKDNDPNHKGATDKAQAILKGAMQEFLVHGYVATSMERVAAAAGVSKPTLYSHFQDKESLFTALVQRLAQEKHGAIFHSPDSYLFQGEPSLVLRHLATLILDHLKGESQLLAFIRLIIGESGRFPELARIMVRNIDKPMIERLSQYFVSRPELQLSDPKTTAQIFIGALVHFVIIQEMLQSQDILPMERDRFINNLIALIVVDSAVPPK